MTRKNNKATIDKLSGELKQCFDSDFSEEMVALAADIIGKIEKAWDEEEKYWEQRARVNWLKSGDQNTRFFHATTVQRRKRNKILKMKDADGAWLENEDDIAGAFMDFYRGLFAPSAVSNCDALLEFVDSVISDEDNVMLMKPISTVEIKRAAFEMGSLKAPGPDGFSGSFYHSSWNRVEADVVRMVRSFFDGSGKIDPLHDTNIVLIPKVEGADAINLFRPISLCNFSYKIVSKIIVNRMKSLLDKCVSPNQRAFVPGRLIQDNILIAHEAFHHLKTNKKGSRFEMAVKIDMNKAYDRLEGSFIENVLLKLGFCNAWVNRVMSCIASVKYNLLFSGKKVGSFTPHRGLRQGDPLSPYIFIFASDVLSRVVSAFAEIKEFEGIKIARTCPVLTHCMFADDALFFLKASEKNCLSFKQILDWYCSAFGQMISLDKSCLFFSNNTPDEVKEEMCRVLGIDGTTDPGKYLGLSVVWGRSKSEALNFVQEKMLKKILVGRRMFLPKRLGRSLSKPWQVLSLCTLWECLKSPRKSVIADRTRR